jgi:uncharacterized protein
VRVLLSGTSVRAAAESAARAGYEVHAIDAFADIDQHPAVRATALRRRFGARFSAAAAARAARAVACDAVVYLSSFENHPRAVAALAAGRALWGNPPEVLRRARNPLLVVRALRDHGLPAPATYVGRAPLVNAAAAAPWLLKPIASGGGCGVRPWTPAGAADGPLLPRGCYLQAFVPGTPASVVFVAAGGRAVVLGLSRQLVGDAAFGASGYQYCGSILCPPGDPLLPGGAQLLRLAAALAGAVAGAFGLTGVNGVDFVVKDGMPWAVEVNPRWCASMELVERAAGLSVFEAHAEACTSGTLPARSPQVPSPAGATGKAVVFARHDVTVGDTRAWLSDASVRDVPHPGERIHAGRPVCTVFASGIDGPACHAALVARAARVDAELYHAARAG